MTLTSEDRKQLIELNGKIGEAELQRTDGFLQEILADDLQFRRASGAVVDKATYCQGVVDDANTYEYSHSDGYQMFAVGDSALVSLLVRSKGVRGKGTSVEKPFAGVYRNIRVFRRNPEAAHGWLCYFWFNDQVTI
jgi:hypothetical protein